MIDKGIAQKDIAKMLGVTEPAVTQYKLKKSKRSRGDQVEIDEEMKAEIEKSADMIIDAWREKQEDEFVYEEMTREVNRIIDLLRDRGDLCEIHREYCAHIEEECTACKHA
jgi:predicted transcriptional regulator